MPFALRPAGYGVFRLPTAIRNQEEPREESADLGLGCTGAHLAHASTRAPRQTPPRGSLSCCLFACVLCSPPAAPVLCDKPCTLRFKHADDACIYNSITGTLKRAGFVEQLATSGRERFAWNLRWGKHMMPEAFKDLKSYQKINHFPVRETPPRTLHIGRMQGCITLCACSRCCSLDSS